MVLTVWWHRRSSIDGLGIHRAQTPLFRKQFECDLDAQRALFNEVRWSESANRSRTPYAEFNEAFPLKIILTTCARLMKSSSSLAFTRPFVLQWRVFRIICRFFIRERISILQINSWTRNQKGQDFHSLFLNFCPSKPPTLVEITRIPLDQLSGLRRTSSNFRSL